MNDKVLFVATANPFVAGGGPQAMRAYLDAIIDIFGISNVSVMMPDGVEVIPAEYKKCTFIKIPPRSKIKGLLDLFCGKTGRFSKPVVDIIKTSPRRFNWCIFNCGRESGWSFKRIRNVDIRKVSIHHNQEVEYCMDNKTIYTFGGRFPYIVKREEKNAYIHSDYNLFLTSEDQKLFAKNYGHTNASNCLIGTFDYKSASIITPLGKSKKEYDLVASGSLSQYQTVHGIMDFCNNYFEVSKRLIPDLKVLFTGRDPRKEIYELQEVRQSSIDIVPSPIDIQKEVSRGKIYLCPTDIGGGLKLRAMDGLKNGLPVLVHEVSARGYDYFFDKPYFRVYNDKETYTNGLKEILEYLRMNPNCSETINQDYYEYFGYREGLERMKEALL